MDVGRALVLATGAIVVVCTLLTGPHVGIIGVQADGGLGGDDLATGNATLTEVDFPENPTISAAQYDAGQFILRTGDVGIRVSNVTGRPLLVYKLDIRGLDYTRSSLTVLDPGRAGRRSIQLTRVTLSADAVEGDSYPGELRLILRGDGPDREIATRNVTVTVQR
ncbi:MAG: hypothetical protein V5A43_09585 [Haloarculaceae archaeon]